MMYIDNTGTFSMSLEYTVVYRTYKTNKNV